jgi:hypothetical protein
VLVACDGAGSAPLSAVGAELVAETISDIFLDLAHELEKRRPGEWLIDEIVQAIVAARARIRDQCGPKNSIADYHTTLVAIVCHSTGGFICHIGDGWGVAVTEQSGGGITSTVSPPRNGEYANETFFVTEPGWIKNLQVTPFSGAPVFAGVMTDGAGSLFQARGELDFQKIIFFVEDHSQADQSVIDFISSREAEKTSGDDKSIAFFIDLFKIRGIDARQLPQLSAAPTVNNNSVAINNSTARPLNGSAKARSGPIKKKANSKNKLTWFILSAIVITVIIAAMLVYFFKNMSQPATQFQPLPLEKSPVENKNSGSDAPSLGNNQPLVVKDPQEQPNPPQPSQVKQLDNSKGFTREPFIDRGK